MFLLNFKIKFIFKNKLDYISLLLKVIQRYDMNGQNTPALWLWSLSCHTFSHANDHLTTLCSQFKLENPQPENRSNQTGYCQSNLPESEQVKLLPSKSVSNPLLFIHCSFRFLEVFIKGKENHLISKKCDKLLVYLYGERYYGK